MHKLSSPWEGPFIVKAVTRPGFYRLCDMDERDVPNSWHIDLLRCFYPWSIHSKRYVPLTFEYTVKFFTLMFLHIVLSMLSASNSALNVLKMIRHLRSMQIPKQTRWCSDASRDEPISNLSLHVHERPPSASWVVDSGSLVMPYFFPNAHGPCAMRYG